MNVCLECFKISPLSTSKGYIREKRDVKKVNKDHKFYQMLPHKNSLSRTELFTLEKGCGRERYINIQFCKDQKELILSLHFSICHMAIKSVK